MLLEGGAARRGLLESDSPAPMLCFPRCGVSPALLPLPRFLRTLTTDPLCTGNGDASSAPFSEGPDHEEALLGNLVLRDPFLRTPVLRDPGSSENTSPPQGNAFSPPADASWEDTESAACPREYLLS